MRYFTKDIISFSDSEEAYQEELARFEERANASHQAFNSIKPRLDPAVAHIFENTHDANITDIQLDSSGDTCNIAIHMSSYVRYHKIFDGVLLHRDVRSLHCDMPHPPVPSYYIYGELYDEGGDITHNILLHPSPNEINIRCASIEWQPKETPPLPYPESLFTWHAILPPSPALPVLHEASQTVYYADAEGLLQYNLKTGETTRLLEAPDITQLTLHNNALYYLYGHTRIARLCMNSHSHTILWNTPEKEWCVRAFCLYNNSLYIQTGHHSLYACSPDTGAPTRLLERMPYTAFTLDGLLFNVHMSVLLSVHTALEPDFPPHALAESFYDGNERYFCNQALALDGCLYYTRQFPGELYRRTSGGADTLIYTTTNQYAGDICLCAHAGKLYFAVTGPKNPSLQILCHDPATNETKAYPITSAPFRWAEEIAILDGVLFFRDHPIHSSPWLTTPLP